jgi:hypothetical protein
MAVHQKLDAAMAKPALSFWWCFLSPISYCFLPQATDDSAIAQEAKTSPRQAPKVKNLRSNASDVGKSLADRLYDLIRHPLAS